MSNRQPILPVILSGGSGTRLWPLSRKGYPKQFIALVTDKSLFQDTLLRLNGLPDALAPMVVCNEEHRFIIAEQALAVGTPLSSILLEPTARNTAPAIAIAALKAQQNGDDPLLLVLPSDHVITDIAAFHAAVQHAVQAAAAGQLVTFGIVPTHPETGYGYIQADPAQTGPTHDGPSADNPGTATHQSVRAFVEKPSRATAQRYLNEGSYYWNSGMFLFRASAYLTELNTHQPAILQHCQAALTGARNDLDFCRIESTAFSQCPSNSIDYAVMEKTAQATVVPLQAGWNDVGAWPAVWQIADKDTHGNAHHGDVLLDNARNNYVYAQHRLVSVLGVDNLTVIETPDAVLVTQHDQAQGVKKIVDRLNHHNRSESSHHRQVFRPWGTYDSIDEGHRFKVKHITVKPGEKLSLQMHHHRAEHWIVVSGTANVHINDQTKLVSENESTYIPIGSRHSLENPGKLPLELIEVQTGAYLGEDDIVRFEDRYGRAPTRSEGK